MLGISQKGSGSGTAVHFVMGPLVCRCVTMLTNLYHGETDNNGLGTGTATIGSSEAIMLGGLAMKKAWQAKRKAAGKPIDKPNLVSLA